VKRIAPVCFVIRICLRLADVPFFYVAVAPLWCFLLIGVFEMAVNYYYYYYYNGRGAYTDGQHCRTSLSAVVINSWSTSTARIKRIYPNSNQVEDFRNASLSGWGGSIREKVHNNSKNVNGMFLDKKKL